MKRPSRRKSIPLDPSTSHHNDHLDQRVHATQMNTDRRGTDNFGQSALRSEVRQHIQRRPRNTGGTTDASSKLRLSRAKGVPASSRTGTYPGNSLGGNSTPDQRIHIIGFDLETSLPSIFSTKLPVFRSPLFNLRCIPFSRLPPRKVAPYPMQENERWKMDNRCIYFTVLSSKNAVSKLAIERNRCKRRFKAALDEILNKVQATSDKDKDIDAKLEFGLNFESGDRRTLVNNQYAYIASLTAEIHDAPFQQIQMEILKGLQYLQKAHSRNQISQATLPLPLPRYIPRGKNNMVDTSGKKAKMPLLGTSILENVV
ncbi:uncharacterized protein I303_106116 [Kwoniella dejecticola CBS 10117]|uniref:Uncharacterized protein n=1 Tax=Kwoniella dejecticola CBS 10117 TaxID=1296121 RepID=A0A1A6A1C5_9TREE|nr:uncharacterized protein I303_06135 [Kwoniella dejecticola CBS 10117]OBR83852.1 hypothetical protein I303_06135 [Kwoniella dejecticola CBS 10117]